MIGDIRRRISQARQSEAAWDLDQRLEVEGMLEENEIVEQSVVLPIDLIPKPAQTLQDYYSDLLRTAIDHGGKFRGQEIPLHWLRMTLSGLEGNRMVPMASWDAEQVGPEPARQPKEPEYHDLFPTNPEGPKDPEPSWS